MTWAEFATDAKLMMAKEEDDLRDLTQLQIIALKQSQAKEDMKWDLTAALALTYNDTEFESYLDANKEYLQEALACRQLYLYYLERNGGEGSSAELKSKHYFKVYEGKRQRFASLITTNIPEMRTARIYR